MGVDFMTEVKAIGPIEKLARDIAARTVGSEFLHPEEVIVLRQTPGGLVRSRERQTPSWSKKNPDVYRIYSLEFSIENGELILRTPPGGPEKNLDGGEVARAIAPMYPDILFDAVVSCDMNYSAITRWKFYGGNEVHGATYFPDDPEWPDQAVRLQHDNDKELGLCRVYLSVRGKDMSAFKEWLGAENLSLNRICKTPEELVYDPKEEGDEYDGGPKAEFDCRQLQFKPVLHRWRLENWGTSREINHDFYVDEDDLPCKWDKRAWLKTHCINDKKQNLKKTEDRVDMAFATVWTPPTQAIHSLSRMFPQNRFLMASNLGRQKQWKLISYQNGEPCDMENAIVHAFGRLGVEM